MEQDGLQVRPFAALRPTVENTQQVACVPYDTVSTAEARALSDGNPSSFLRVVRAEVDLPAGTDSYADEVYARSAENLARFEDEGVLVRDDAPSFYVYRIRMGEHTQTGIVGCCEVSQYRDGTIKRHEQTRHDKLADRIRLVKTLRAHSGPVFLTYRDDAHIDALVERVVSADPDVYVTGPSGTEHSVWRVTDTEAFECAFRGVDAAYIADGHHRAAAAEAVAAELAPDGAAASRRFLNVLFPASQLKILAYNRCVTDLNGLDAAGFLAKLGEVCTVTPAESAEPSRPGRVTIYLDGTWHELVPRAPLPNDPVASLDVSWLQARVLEPILAIHDPRADDRITFVGGIRGTAELERMVDGGEWAVAFSLHPVTVECMMSVADVGQNMPPKSTWFEPKLLSGLFVHTF